MPPAQLEWLHNGTEIKDAGNKYFKVSGRVLAIPFVGEKDQGNYTCIAKNSFGSVASYYSKVKIYCEYGFIKNYILILYLSFNSFLYFSFFSTQLVNGCRNTKCFFYFPWELQPVIYIIAYFDLALSWQSSLSYRNQSIDLLWKSMNWFLYDKDLSNERVNESPRA